MTSLKKFDCYCHNLTDDGLTALSQSRSLEYLEIPMSQCTDAGIAQLTALKSLRGLTIGSSALTDDSLRTIGTWAPLQRLSLSRTNITDAGLAHLSGLRELDHLYLSDNPQLTGAGLVHLQSLPLKYVSVTGPGVTDEGLEPLAAFRELTLAEIGHGRTALAAGETYRVTDIALTHLARLPKLQCAFIDGAAITDRGVLVLKQPSLEHVRCQRCPRLTRKGVKAWCAAAPHVNVEWL